MIAVPLEKYELELLLLTIMDSVRSDDFIRGLDSLGYTCGSVERVVDKLNSHLREESKGGQP